MLQTMDDSELIRRYKLDHAWIMFVTDLIILCSIKYLIGLERS